MAEIINFRRVAQREMAHYKKRRRVDLVLPIEGVQLTGFPQLLNDEVIE
jgi:hypothetical protein